MLKDNIQYLPYQNLPNFSPFFWDYVAGNEKALQFYNGNPFREEDWARIVSQRFVQNRDRSSLAGILSRQNNLFGYNELQQRQIDRLKDSSTVVIITGQQAGIFSGPLYTIYKAITAIQLAQSLDKKGIPCVPIFWMETNDHDFREIQTIGLFNNDNTPVQINYNDPEIIEGTPVGNIQISSRWGQFFHELRSVIRESEFTSDIFRLINETYQPGRKFGEAFAFFMQRLFAPYGLILFDPMDAAVSSLTKNLIHRILDTELQITAEVSEVTQQLLQQGYHAQVKIPEDSAHLFYNDNGRRLLLKRNSVWKYGETSASEREIGELVDNFPERFSPTVLTRPIFQDYLFPTIGYVAGPSEIAYWAQIKPLYALLDISMPLVYPRASITLLEPKIAGLIEEYQLSMPQVLSGSEKLIREIMHRIVPESGEGTFNNFREDITTFCEQLFKMTEQVDKTLKGAVDTMREKTLFQVNKLQEKYDKALEKKHTNVVEQLKRITTHLLPQGKLQERELNICSFFFRHGIELIPHLMQTIPLNTSQHLLISL